MKKIPTLYKRDPDNRSRLLPEVHPDCQWVIDGEGVATVKSDGTCCLIKDGELFKRREIKSGKTVPDNFTLVEHDEATGKSVGWVPVDLEAKEDRWHAEAWRNESDPYSPQDGTYELVGPKIQGNPEHYVGHLLFSHEHAPQLTNFPTDLHGLELCLSPLDIEGLVWHHPDGRMAKIKLKDFGLKRGAVV